MNDRSEGKETWSNPVCGQCLRVRYPVTGATVVVSVSDSCPGCALRSTYALDLSHQAFADLVGGWDRATELGIIPSE
jgi:expansin (peptidoglycan-binding protein)